MKIKKAIELINERNRLYRELKEKQKDKKEIENILNNNTSEKTDYTGKVVVVTDNPYVKGQEQNKRFILVEKCIYKGDYVLLSGKEITEEKDIITIWDNEGLTCDVRVKDGKLPYLYIMSDEEYNQFIMETCESIKKKLLK